MDKNPDKIPDHNFTEMLDKIIKNNLSIVQFTDAYEKLNFLNRLISLTSMPVIFLDFDLLYSGYVVSRIIPANEKIQIFRPTRDTIQAEFSNIVKMISCARHIIVLDSLNGFYNIFDERVSGVLINRIAMFLEFISRNHDSTTIISAMVRKKENEWVLSPRCRQIIDVKNAQVFNPKNNDNISSKIP